MLRRLLAAAAAAWLMAAGSAHAGAFADWSAVVVAGDFHAQFNQESEGFDNARRDVAIALTQTGFQPQNVRQFSVRPERYADTHPGPAQLQPIFNGMRDGARDAAGGCLFYISSHGSPEGAVLGAGILKPGTLATMLDQSCGARPTIVVVSACYSGVFVTSLAKPNRMVLTAARSDRTSFGCGVDIKYPFFDDCFLQAMPRVRHFESLAGTVQACVSQREAAERVSPPSLPQVYLGPQLRPMLPLYAFDAPKPAPAGVSAAATGPARVAGDAAAGPRPAQRSR